MKIYRVKQEHGAGNLSIRFPPNPSLSLEPGQVVLNGLPVTVKKTDEGQLQISDQEFIQRLIDLGFQCGRNDSAERLAEILRDVPVEYRQAFLDGVTGKPLRPSS